jgi:hypothetical protein
MIHLIKRTVCKLRGHALELAGSCPFTGSRYYYCNKCEMMIPVDVVQ